MKIVVLAGGTSTERAISIISGTGICKALRQKGHQAILADVFCGVENVDWENPFPEEYDVDAASAYMSGFDDKIETMKKERRSFFGENILKLCEMADIVFLGLHGSNGEDGRLQATFDLMGIRYTGTGYLSSAMAMDKGITKQMFMRTSGRSLRIPMKPLSTSRPLIWCRKSVAMYGVIQTAGAKRLPSQDCSIVPIAAARCMSTAPTMARGFLNIPVPIIPKFRVGHYALHNTVSMRVLS